MGRRVGTLQISIIIWTEGPCPIHWQQTFIELGELCRGQQQGHWEGTQGVLGPVRQLFCTFYMDTIWPLHSFWTRLPFKKQFNAVPVFLFLKGHDMTLYTFFAHVCIYRRQLLKLNTIPVCFYFYVNSLCTYCFLHVVLACFIFEAAVKFHPSECYIVLVGGSKIRVWNICCCLFVTRNASTTCTFRNVVKVYFRKN